MSIDRMYPESSRLEVEQVISDILRPELDADGFTQVEVRYAHQIGVECHPLLGAFTAPNVSQLWGGSGPGMVLACPPVPDVATAIFATVSMACHEAGHLADRRELPPAQCDQVDAIRSTVATSPHEWPEYRGRPQWFGHESKWIRATLNVRHRMIRRGLFPGLVITLNTKGYGLSAPETYLAALGWECSYERSVPLSELLATPAPKEFTDLFTKDVIRSLSQGKVECK